MINFDEKGLSGMKVLMVDDTPTNLDILGHIMKMGGLSLSVAPNGETALKIISRDKPDLILLDVMMPGINGFEVCEKLKEDDNTKDIPVIFITAKVETDDIVRGFDVGGVDYIIKPFNEKEVLVRVGTQLSLKKAAYEKEALIRELDSLSRIDPLTKLSNRRDIFEKLEYEQAKFERYGKDFSIILGDIDYFKKINDQFGHDAGDYVLKEVSAIFKSSVRKVDNVSRWGGEEFLAVLTETNLSGAARVADKIRIAIEKHKFEFDKNPAQVTMSFGIACHAGKDGKIDGLIKEADKLLYKAKEQGRNQVVSM
jgi:diguanylate cyclase (GGDEF)-like protein